jgi:integrase
VRAVDVTVATIDRFKVERRNLGRAAATINRELELLGQAYRLAVRQGRLSVARAPEVERLPVDNVRTGFFERAEIEALLSQIPDGDVRDFVECGFRTGMRKGEIAQLTWDMLDRAGDVWALRIPGPSPRTHGRGPSASIEGPRCGRSWSGASRRAGSIARSFSTG